METIKETLVRLQEELRWTDDGTTVLELTDREVFCLIHAIEFTINGIDTIVITDETGMVVADLPGADGTLVDNLRITGLPKGDLIKEIQ